ncbi:MAG: radical SAM protein [Christensenellales bacterium]|jgi:uncharacterized protein
MRHIELLVKPASGRCNLDCKYCFYHDIARRRRVADAGFMKLPVMRGILEGIHKSGAETCTLGFQGGEPLMVGLEFFREMVGMAQKYAPGTRFSFTVQTNGLLVDEDWAGFFAGHGFLVGVSLDGTRQVHDAYRGAGTYDKVMAAVGLLREKGAALNILSVVTDTLADNIAEVYRLYRANRFDHLQFIPCLDALGTGGPRYFLSAQKYGDFLKALFDLWYADILEGRDVSIRYFEDLLLAACGVTPPSCTLRGGCAMQFVTEADAAVYPCDFYALDEYALGNLTKDTPDELMRRFLQSDFYTSSKNMDEACRSCAYLRLCGGGCRRHHIRGKDRFCGAYRAFFGHALPRILSIAEAVMPLG